MTRILFIDAIRSCEHGRRFETLFDHPGLLYLCGALRKHFGHDHFQLKIVHQAIEQNLRDFQPDIVGITSVTQNFIIAKEYARQAKAAGCCVIIGGGHISALPSCLPKHADVAVVGEGEDTIIDLVHLFEEDGNFEDTAKLHELLGIAYWEIDATGPKIVQTGARAAISPLDDIPYQARDLSYLSQNVGVFASRGCPYRCRYCFTKAHWNKTRFFSVDYLVEEIRMLAEQHKHITIFDDLFVANKRRLAEIVERLKKHRIPQRVTFNCNVRANRVDEEVAFLLKEMGMKSVFIGIESGSQRVLTYLKGERMAIAENRNAIEVLSKHGIGCSAGIIIGSPTETREEVLDTLKFVKQSKLDRFFVFTLTPYPGTDVWDYALDKGLVSSDMDWDLLRMEFSEVPDKAIIMSEALSRGELWQLYQLFGREALRRRIRNRLRLTVEDPLQAVQEMARIIGRTKIGGRVKKLVGIEWPN